MLRNYLLTAWKVFMRRKLFTAINLACIVLTLIVLMVITAMLETAFFPKGVEGKSDRMLQVALMRLDSKDGHRTSHLLLGYKLIDKYLKPLQGAERVSAVTIPETVAVYQDQRVTELQMRRADADYWKVLDFRLLAGRLPTPDDDIAGRSVAVLNQTSARKLFSGEAGSAIGQRIDVGGRNFEVIGVVGDELHLNAYADIWAPITSLASTDYREQLSGTFNALILARSPADLPRIRQQVEHIARSMQTDDPKEWVSAHFWADSKLDLFARTVFHRYLDRDSGAGRLVAIIVGAMLLFMLLPALNLVNLNTGRIMERRSEIGVRKAFGATSGQLAMQLVIENILLCLAGGVVALAATAGVLHWIENAGLIPYLKVDMDLAVFGYGLLAASVFGVLSGVLPAWRMSRLDPVHALKGNL
ncbi:ABC transporter permease [Massilia oculi]|uniref:ABC transporter permease n=1 Tax=Massilia hydrophila TaxID=3044279 RepID=A0ABS7Y960_9BURK|nr:ABC transporter permease [Massilia oculi]MCA1855079.1 ABC transporter permease [Massilia oculi]